MAAPAAHAPASSGKKRKRDRESNAQAAPEAGPSRIRVLEAVGEGLGPVLVGTTSTALPADHPLDLYRHKSRPERTVLHLDGPRVDWESANHQRGADVEDNSRYMVGVFRRSTGSLNVLPVELHAMRPTVKALRQAEEEAQTRVARTAVERQADRIRLGEAFGSSKHKRKLRNDARALEALDTKQEGLQALQPLLQQGIDVATATLPTRETVKQATDDARPIPPYDLAATEVRDVYRLEDIISAAELGALGPVPILKAATAAERQKLLAFSTSTFVNDLVEQVVRGSSGVDDIKARAQIRVLMALAAMMSFFKAKGPGTRRVKGMPKAVGVGLIERFAETTLAAEVGVTGPKAGPFVTPATEVKLLSYIAALALHADGFTVDCGVLASDLGLTVLKLSNVYRSLGCKISTITTAERTTREKLGRTCSARGGAAKMAKLVVPLVFAEGGIGRKR